VSADLLGQPQLTLVGQSPAVMAPLEVQAKSGTGSELGSHVAELDEADRKVKRLGVGIPGDQQTPGAAGPGSRGEIGDQPAGDPSTLPRWVHEQVLELQIRRVAGGSGRESHRAIVDEGDQRPAASDSRTGKTRYSG